MKKLWETIKNNPEITGYVILSLLLFGSCFIVEFAFAAAIYIFIFAFFLRNEGKILGLMFFLLPFSLVLNTIIVSCNLQGEVYVFGLFSFVLNLLKIFIFLLYISRVLRKEKILNFKIFIPMILFFVYIILPVHECKFEDFFEKISTYLLLYVVWEERREINLTAILYKFSIGLILSCVFGLYYKFSPLLTSIIQPVFTETDLQRYFGLNYHTNTLAYLSVLLISSLLLIKYKNKINTYVFYIIFIIVYVFGFLTVSRAYLLLVLVAIIIFSLLLIINKKKSIYFTLWTFFMIIIVVGLIFSEYSKSYLDRYTSNYESFFVNTENPDGSWLIDDAPAHVIEGILSGEFTNVLLFRDDLYKFYLMDWTSSLSTIFFGRGISRLWIGGYSSHNFYLQRLWEHGIIGFIFYFLIFCLLIDWKNIKKYKHYVPILIFIIPTFGYSLVETNSLEYNVFVLLFLIIGWLEKASTENENKKLAIGKICNDNVMQLSLNSIENNLKNIKLSIIIPVYNGEKYIKSCLDRVLLIDINKEIIVINDGSTDNSLEILMSYGKLILLVNLKENLGVSHARNIGLEKASGDYIAFIDVDDDFELDMHGKIITKMIKEDADVGMCRYDQRNENSDVLKVEKPFGFKNLSQDDVIKYYLLDKFICAVWTSVYKSSIAKTIRFEEKVKIGEDRLYQLRILLKAQKTSFVNEILYHYVKNSTSTTHVNSTPENASGHLEIPTYLTTKEKDVLNNEFKEEFEFFKLWSICLVVNMVSQWYRKNKKQKKVIKKFFKNLLSDDVYKKIFKNKFMSKQIKLEFFVLNKFGISFHLYVFPFYKFIKKILRFFVGVS